MNAGRPATVTCAQIALGCYPLEISRRARRGRKSQQFKDGRGQHSLQEWPLNAVAENHLDVIVWAALRAGTATNAVVGDNPYFASRLTDDAIHGTEQADRVVAVVTRGGDLI